MSTLPRSSPISLSDEQLSVVMSAASLLPQGDRDRFLKEVADALRDVRELGDGVLGRTIRDVLGSYWRPLEMRPKPTVHRSPSGPAIP
jgi:hypothetical protein